MEVETEIETLRRRVSTLEGDTRVVRTEHKSGFERVDVGFERMEAKLEKFLAEVREEVAHIRAEMARDAAEAAQRETRLVWRMIISLGVAAAILGLVLGLVLRDGNGNGNGNGGSPYVVIHTHTPPATQATAAPPEAAPGIVPGGRDGQDAN